MLVKMSNALLLIFYDLIFFFTSISFFKSLSSLSSVKNPQLFMSKNKNQLSNYWSMTVRVEKRKTRVQMNFGCVYFFNNNSIWSIPCFNKLLLKNITDEVKCGLRTCKISWRRPTRLLFTIVLFPSQYLLYLLITNKSDVLNNRTAIINS